MVAFSGTSDSDSVASVASTGGVMKINGGRGDVLAVISAGPTNTTVLGTYLFPFPTSVEYGDLLLFW